MVNSVISKFINSNQIIFYILTETNLKRERKTTDFEV